MKLNIDFLESSRCRARCLVREHFIRRKQTRRPSLPASRGYLHLGLGLGKLPLEITCLHGGAFLRITPMRKKRIFLTSTLAIFAASLLWGHAADADSPTQRKRSGRSSTEFKAYQQRLKSRRDAGLSARRQIYGNRDYSHVQTSKKKYVNISNPSGSFVWGYNYKGRNQTRFSFGKDPNWRVLKTPLTPTGDSKSIGDK